MIPAALAAKKAFVQLDAAFADEADEDETNRRMQGHAIAACAVLDEWGSELTQPGLPRCYDSVRRTRTGAGFWALPDALLHAAAPWNGRSFRTARYRLFLAAIQLRHAVIVAAVRTIKPSLNIITKPAQGAPNAPTPGD